MDSTLKRLAVLGSTGSIGRQTLEIVSAFPRHFRVTALAAGSNTALLARQVDEFKPSFVCYQDDSTPLPTEARYEFLEMEEIARHPDIDMVVVATSGRWGLKPTLAALSAGKPVALANKETLVMAGEIVAAEVKRGGGKLLPIDSEHSAVWQCLQGEKKNKPSRIILTASGGPFRGYSKAELARVTPQQALKHPSWRMGEKVTIDSATLMNKGLEVIEAHWLFDIPFDNIEVLVHPQSIVHSLVEFADGSLKAQLGYPDMRLPIQYALSYPERLANPRLPRLDWGKIKELSFEPPDFEAFPCLKTAIEAGKKGGSYPAALCGADEAAVQLFLSGRIGFGDIAGLVERALEEHRNIAKPSLEEILTADDRAGERVRQLAAGEKR